MTTAIPANTTSFVFSYFSNLKRAADDFIGAMFFVKPSTFAASFATALAARRVIGEEGRKVSPKQLKELRKILDLEPVAE